MDKSDFAGATVALVFTSLAFVISVYELFALRSELYHTPVAWFMMCFSFGGMIFSAYIFNSKHPFFPILSIVCAVVVGILAISTSVHYLLACMAIALIGGIIQLA